MRRKLTPRQWGKVNATTTPNVGYRGSENEVYCLTCLCKDDSICYDQNKPITKQAAFKESLICSKCGELICPVKHSKFLKRVADAKRHRTKND